MRLLLAALLCALSYAQTVGSEKFVPDEIPQPPNTAKEGILPPLTDLAEKHGMKEHKAYTQKLNKKVVELEENDVKAGNALVHTLEKSVEDAKQKLELAKESRDTAKEKVENDKRNHVAAGIFMHAEIKEAMAQKKKFKELADTAESRAQVKVKQAQADVAAKNEIISQKDSDIDRLTKDVKNEQAKGESACDARIGKQRREYQEKEKQLTKIKDDEINQAKEAAKKAEEATSAERQQCQSDAEAAKERCESEVNGVKEQVSTLQSSLQEKNEGLKQAAEKCTEKVTEAKNQCAEEKKEVQDQAKQACDVEVSNEREKVKTAEDNLLAEKQKLADIEKRLTQEKDDAIAKCEEQKDAVDRAARDEITKNQSSERGTCDKQKRALKDAHKGMTEHLHKEIFQLRSDYKKAIETMQKTQSQELKALRDQLRAAEKARDDYKDSSASCSLKYKQVENQLKQNLEVTKSTALDLKSDASGKTIELEEEIAAIESEDMPVSSTATIVYASLIASSVFLSGLIVKLRGQAMKLKSYHSVLTEA